MKEGVKTNKNSRQTTTSSWKPRLASDADQESRKWRKEWMEEVTQLNESVYRPMISLLQQHHHHHLLHDPCLLIRRSLTHTSSHTYSLREKQVDHLSFIGCDSIQS